MAKQETINDPALYTRLDISGELWRSYQFPDGDLVLVSSPETLYIRKGQNLGAYGGGSHRIVTKNGQGVYIPRGWLCITWTNADPATPINF